MTDEESKLVNEIMAENKAAKERIAAQEYDLRAAKDAIADAEKQRGVQDRAIETLKNRLAKQPDAPKVGAPKAGRRFRVKVLAAGGVILPYESEATPYGMSVHVEQPPAREGHYHVDVERALLHLQKCGHVEVGEDPAG